MLKTYDLSTDITFISFHLVTQSLQNTIGFLLCKVVEFYNSLNVAKFSCFVFEILVFWVTCNHCTGSATS